MDHQRNTPFSEGGGEKVPNNYPDTNQCTKLIYIDTLNPIPIDPLNLNLLGYILVHKCKYTHQRTGVMEFLG